MMLLQHEPSAHAPWTKITVAFCGNSPVLAGRPGKLVASCAVFCARKDSVKEPSSATPRDAAVSAPRKLRRFISSSSFQFLLPKNELTASALLIDLSPKRLSS